METWRNNTEISQKTATKQKPSEAEKRKDRQPDQKVQYLKIEDLRKENTENEKKKIKGLTQEISQEQEEDSFQIERAP